MRLLGVVAFIGAQELAGDREATVVQFHCPPAEVEGLEVGQAVELEGIDVDQASIEFPVRKPQDPPADSAAG